MSARGVSTKPGATIMRAASITSASAAEEPRYALRRSCGSSVSEHSTGEQSPLRFGLGANVARTYNADPIGRLQRSYTSRFRAATSR
jgi:hypothetical protein